MSYGALPPKQGLYDPANEHDACGVGFVAHIKGRQSHAIVRQGLQILENLTHRGAVGADPLAGDGDDLVLAHRFVGDAQNQRVDAVVEQTLHAAQAGVVVMFNRTPAAALMEIYKKLRPGEPPSAPRAQSTQPPSSVEPAPSSAAARAT